MNAVIEKVALNGSLRILGSKSFAHRLLLGAFLSKQECQIDNVPDSMDIEATLSCIKNMGGNFLFQNHKVEFFKPYRFHRDEEIVLPCFESGSTMRFIIPVALTLFNKIKVTGSETLIKRGISEYQKIFDKNGIKYQIFKDSILIEGHFCSATFEVNGDISSQYITGLLFALPVLDYDSTIRIIPPLHSKNYIDITLSILDLFKIKYEINGYDIQIFGRQNYQGGNYTCEGDYSNAAFLSAFNYFNSHVDVLGLNQNSLQGDKAYEHLFKKLSEGYQEINVSNCIDLCPILFVFAYLNKGAKFIGTSRLKYKESNRALAIKEALEKIKGRVEIKEDSVIVYPKEKDFIYTSFNTDNDHRICMALSLLSSQQKIKLFDIDCVKKSYPDYFKDLESLGASIHYEE